MYDTTPSPDTLTALAYHLLGIIIMCEFRNKDSLLIFPEHV